MEKGSSGSGSSSGGYGRYDFSPDSGSYSGNSIYSAFNPTRMQSLTPSSGSSTTTNSSPRESCYSGVTKQALSFIVQNHQDFVNRHNLVLNHLREVTREAEALRHENASLRILNRDLNERLALMIQSSLSPSQRSLSPSCYSEMAAMMQQRFGGLCIGDSGESPTSVIEQNVMEMPPQVETPVRVALPKSISVRSDAYVKAYSAGVKSGGSVENRARSSSKVQAAANPLTGKQRVYVQGGRKEGEAVELEVYNQGMQKTELCNKWQETGECPYGDHCQFAHGIEELRPVLRHPRYKTEVCRMVLAGDRCPYGHRCHFRHALTEEEKQMRMSPHPDTLGGHFVSPSSTN